jgi:ectoine hydroxylase-related dioxygenase (phytanoyl-CoA dioxygenase family)
MSVLFLNNKDESFFKIHGYLKLDNVILNQNEIKELLELKESMLISDVKNKIEKGFFVGMEHPDKVLVKKISEKIINTISEKLNHSIINYKPFLANFIIKESNKNAKIFPHQDWTFVEDEINNHAVTCWIPLVDVNMDNGCIGVIKGSHKFLNNIRYSPPVAGAPSPLANHSDKLIPYFEWIPMRAGEVLFFDYRIFHASITNSINNDRTAIGVWFANNNAEFRHYYLKPKTTNILLKYKVDADFYIKYDNVILSNLYLEGKIIDDYEMLEEILIEDAEISWKKMQKLTTQAGNIFSNIVLEKNMYLKKSKFKYYLKKISNLFN